MNAPRVAYGVRSPRWLLPLAVFAGVFALHFFWDRWFPGVDSAQARWDTMDESPWPISYFEFGEYWFGYAYGLAAAFAAASLRNLLELKRLGRADATSTTATAGSVTFAGALAAGGCFLVGCCGSPMLAVWLSFLGPSVLPFTKPIVAAITTVMVGGCWLWMVCKRRDSYSDNCC